MDPDFSQRKRPRNDDEVSLISPSIQDAMNEFLRQPSGENWEPPSVSSSCPPRRSQRGILNRSSKRVDIIEPSYRIVYDIPEDDISSLSSW